MCTILNLKGVRTIKNAYDTNTKTIYVLCAKKATRKIYSIFFNSTSNKNYFAPGDFVFIYV